jgi:hypothetical protein
LFRANFPRSPPDEIIYTGFFESRQSTVGN